MNLAMLESCIQKWPKTTTPICYMNEWFRTNDRFLSNPSTLSPITQEINCRNPQEFYDGFNGLLPTNRNDGEFVVHFPIGGDEHMLDFFQSILTKNDDGEYHFMGAVYVESDAEQDVGCCHMTFAMPVESPHQTQPTYGDIDTDTDSDGGGEAR